MIVNAILAIAAIAVIAWGVVPLFVSREPSGLRAVGGLFAGLAVLFASFGITQIDAGYVGVVTNFGQVEEKELGPGLHWRMPFVTRVTVLDTRVQAYHFENIEAFTKEQQPGRLFGVVNYAIDPENASVLVQEVGPDYLNRLIISRADSILKENARRFPTDSITAQRTQLGEETAEALRAELEPFNIQIIDVVVRDIALSPEYLASVEKRQQAQIDQERANIEAETARRRAQGEADAQAIEAEGQARANREITESLTPELIQWQSIQKLNPNVNVIMVPADQGLIVDMGNLSPPEGE